MIMIKVKTIEMTCSACPSQWEGECIDGGDIYIRFRHGGFRIDYNGKEIFYNNPDGDGVMSTDEMIANSVDYLDFSTLENNEGDDVEN